MKKLFYTGIIGLVLFEVLKVYFIMPMPGSQQMDSLDFAYGLHSYRWLIRVIFLVMILAGSISAFSVKRKWLPAVVIILAAFVVYQFNAVMMADQMFKEPHQLVFAVQQDNTLPDSSMVIGIVHEGQARAYPIRFIVYHHQVRDVVGGKPVMVTYCSVCRTGRVYEPVVNNHHEAFRLVGMDHFNAMFEDETTKSWWRQVNGVAVAGPLKGERLPEVPSFQVSLRNFFDQYPFGEVMRADEGSISYYDTLGQFEFGKSKSSLTGTDSLSWKDKSWVVGIEMDSSSKAYDWNQLKEERIIHDEINATPVVLIIADDNQSFMVFKRPDVKAVFRLQQDTLYQDTLKFNLYGQSLTPETQSLERVRAYQEFWHSWRTFHPDTERYE